MTHEFKVQSCEDHSNFRPYRDWYKDLIVKFHRTHLSPKRKKKYGSELSYQEIFFWLHNQKFKKMPGSTPRYSDLIGMKCARALRFLTTLR